MARVKNARSVINNLSKDITKKAQKALVRNAQTIENEIIITMLTGSSPVRGKRWKQYSKAYADRFKKGFRKPVNMKLSGEMLDSLEVKRKGRGISIAFNSPIAVFHDKLGAGKSRIIRRLLPVFSKGETFKSNILNLIIRIAKKGILS